MKKIVSVLVLSLVAFFLTSSLALAHVVVRPAEVAIGAFQTFTVGVPTEKDNPTVALRVAIPDEIKLVTPNVKPGWTIEVKKSGENADAKVTEIIWTGGSIPAGQRDEFLFSAQVPAKEANLVWQAYQTYENGEVVSWDQESNEAKHEERSETKGPYSQTKVINDLKNAKTETPTDNNALPLSITALALAAVSLALQFRKKA
jgi:uncharacterized protein YcnI